MHMQPEKKYNVLIGIPTMDGMCTPLISVLLMWARGFKDVGVSFYFPYKVSPVSRARNEILKFFFKERKNAKGEVLRPFTHLLFIDSDTVPPKDALTDLLDHEVDIVSGITPILHYDTEKGKFSTMDNCFTHQDRDEKTGEVVQTHVVKRLTGLQKIWRCGTSCLLIKREVFEKLEQPYFVFEFNDDGTETKRSEDLYFCDKAHEAGFEIYADTSVICQHVKDVIL